MDNNDIIFLGGSGRATPGGHQQPSPAYKGRGSNAGNAWAAAAQNWAKGAGGADGRTPRGMAGDITPRGPVAGGENTPSYNKGGYSTTPRYNIIYSSYLYLIYYLFCDNCNGSKLGAK